MEFAHEGVSPLSSERLLATARDALRSKGLFESLLGSDMPPLMDEVIRLQPDRYLVDTYLEQSLMGQDASGARAIMALTSTESHYLDHMTNGRWARRVGLPEARLEDSPEQLSCLVVEPGGVRTRTLADASFEAAQLSDQDFLAKTCEALGLADTVHTELAELLRSVSALPLRVALVGGNNPKLTFVPVRTGPALFLRSDYARRLLGLLADCGCDQGRLEALSHASFAYAFPRRDAGSGMGPWVVSVDLGYLTLHLRDGHVDDVRAGILVADRSVSFDGQMTKPLIAYQWHITDNCDQRCKHCYLFAEDAQARCLSTPWDKLIHTLDEVERAAALRHLLPVLAISGGDPILHPRFWDFAAELWRRGIVWSAMGNPFHLDADVCRRLRALGCVKYQMSLDGLEDFHDYLRKPGSYRATLAAMGPLHEAGIRVQLMATASNQNLDDILACMDVAVEHGADSFAFARYCATSPQRARELYPTPEEYRAFLLAYWRKKQAYEHADCRTTFKTKDHLFKLLRWELGEPGAAARVGERPDHVCAGCHLGVKSTIAVNGDLLACRRMESVVGNVWTQGLYEVDESPAMKAFAEVDKIERCRDCELLMFCRGCRAVGVNATGDLQAADPMCWKQ